MRIFQNRRYRLPSRTASASLRLPLICIAAVVFLGLFAVHSPLHWRSSSSDKQHTLDDTTRRSTHAQRREFEAPCLRGHDCGKGGAEASGVRLAVAVVSRADQTEYRDAARATWVRRALKVDGVRVVFFLVESTEALVRESDANGDIMFGATRTDTGALPTGYVAVQQVRDRFKAELVMRVDVRSFVLIERLLSQIERECVRQGCMGEGIWAGKLVTNRLILDAEGKAYQLDTGLTMYLPYMEDGAYVLSGSLIDALSFMEQTVGLKVLASEGISLGLWLVPIAYRRLDLSSVVYAGSPCCVRNGLVDPPDVSVCAGTDIAGDGGPAVLSILEMPAYLHRYDAALDRCKRQ